jgi:YVTN family beta-propeller protein
LSRWTTLFGVMNRGFVMSGAVRLGRVRWAAIGAALAVSLGAGGMGIVNATISSGSKAVYVPIAPCRLADTRPAPDTVGPKSTPIGAGQTHTFTVRGSNGNCSIPTGATAIVANVTAVGPTAQSFMTIWPADQPQPNASSLNYSAGQAPFPNAVTVTLSGDGKIKVANKNGSVHVIVDIAGYYEDHNHDDRYDTKAQVDAKIAANPGPPGEKGDKGDSGVDGVDGAPGPVGPAGPVSASCSATLRWDLPACNATTITVGHNPYAVAFDGAHIWVTSGSNSVSKINPATNTVTATVPVGSSPFGVAFDGAHIWVTSMGSDTVSKIDPATTAVTATVPVGSFPRGVAFDGTSLWVTNSGSDSVSKINPATGTVTATVPVGSSPLGVAFDGTNIWVTNYGSGNVSKINRATGTVTATVPVGSNPLGVAFDGNSVWVADGGNSAVKIDPATGTVTATVTVGANPVGVAYDGNHIWVTNAASDTVSKIDPASNTVAATVPVGVLPVGVAFDGTNIWVANQNSSSVSKIIPF